MLAELCPLADAVVLDPSSLPNGATDLPLDDPLCGSRWRALGGEITPARLAAASRTADPQAVKWLWHCLARFGRQ